MNKDFRDKYYTALMELEDAVSDELNRISIGEAPGTELMDSMNKVMGLRISLVKELDVRLSKALSAFLLSWDKDNSPTEAENPVQTPEEASGQIISSPMTLPAVCMSSRQDQYCRLPGNHKGLHHDGQNTWHKETRV